MICPACQHDHRLTWAKYASPTGYQTCPSCQSQFRIKISLKYHLLVAVILLLAVPLPVALLYWLSHNFFVVLFSTLFLGFAITLPLDRWREDKKGEYVLVKKTK